MPNSFLFQPLKPCKIVAWKKNGIFPNENDENLFEVSKLVKNEEVTQK